MLRCDTCTYMEENRTGKRVRSKKGMLKPLCKYCTNGRLRELKKRALGGVGYPVWCPLNECRHTCVVCGTRIREEEGEYCQEHR